MSAFVSASASVCTPLRFLLSCLGATRRMSRSRSKIQRQPFDKGRPLSVPEPKNCKLTTRRREGYRMDACATGCSRRAIAQAGVYRETQHWINCAGCLRFTHDQVTCKICIIEIFIILRHTYFKRICTQSVDSTVSFFVDSSAQHRGTRPNLTAMKKKNSQSQHLNQVLCTLPECSNW